MTGDVIKDFLVGLGFKIDEAGLSKFSAGIGSATIAVTAMGVAAVAATGLITAFVSSVADKFDTVRHLADRVNSTAESVLRLGYVATLTGSSVNAANSSLEGLSKVAGEAALGIGSGAMAFEQIGLSAKDSNGVLKDTSVLMSDIAVKIRDMGRGEQIAVLSKLGIDPTLIGALTTDVSGLAAEFDQLYKNAGIDANKAAEESVDFVDSMARLKMTFDALKSAVGLKFMGQVKNGINTLRKFLVENMPKIINAVSPIINLVLKIAEAFIRIVGRIGSAIGKIIGFLSNVNDKTDGWAGYILAAAAAWKFLNLSFLASPIGIILALSAGVALLIDDFLTFRESGESLIDWGSKFGTTLQVVSALVAGLTAAFVVSKLAMLAFAVGQGVAVTAGAAVSGILATMRSAVLLFNLALFANPIGLFVAAIATLIGAGALLIANWQSVKTWFTGFFDFLSSGFDKIKSIAGTVAGLFGSAGGAESAPRPALAPTPQAAAAMTGGSQSVSQQTQIVVQGASNPDATARAVSGQQSRVNADMARNMKGVTR